MKEQLLSVAKIRKHSMFIKEEKLPVLSHQSAGFVCKKAQLINAGTCTLDGEQYDFQDIRVYLKEEK